MGESRMSVRWITGPICGETAYNERGIKTVTVVSVSRQASSYYRPAPLDSLQCILSIVEKIREMNRACIDISEIERFEFCMRAVRTFDHHRFKKENSKSACQSLTPLRLTAHVQLLFRSSVTSCVLGSCLRY